VFRAIPHDLVLPDEFDPEPNAGVGESSFDRLLQLNGNRWAKQQQAIVAIPMQSIEPGSKSTARVRLLSEALGPIAPEQNDSDTVAT
jgi:hypothetical protein